MKVLIADDDSTSLFVLSKQLKDKGYEPIESKGGPPAWANYRKFRPSIILLDWQMPELDGLELTQKIREKSQGASYPHIILITAYRGTEKYIQAIEAGADDFLSKPYNPEILGAKLLAAQRMLRLKDEVETLRGILPTCSHCKQIRDEGGTWHPIEHYITERSDASFSHGICPPCLKKHYGLDYEEK